MSYSQALFELSKEDGCEKEVYEAALTLQTGLLSEPKYLFVVSSPVIDIQERMQLLKELLQNCHILLKNMVLLLCEKNEIVSLTEVLNDYIALYRQQNKILEVTALSAVPLSNDMKIRIQSALEKRMKQEILLVTVADESCIGGLKLQMNGRQYDGSIERQLHEIKKILIDNAQIMFEINSAKAGENFDT
ncbi:MAG: ATP synthase F1 subunit delta [Eubacteriales bacterium]|nr:ATP synthase F1 subunit delta [Eubacteriales bacterium]